MKMDIEPVMQESGILIQAGVHDEHRVQHVRRFEDFHPIQNDDEEVKLCAITIEYTARTIRDINFLLFVFFQNKTNSRLLSNLRF
jgi:hypothetical protein